MEKDVIIRQEHILFKIAWPLWKEKLILYVAVFLRVVLKRKCSTLCQSWCAEALNVAVKVISNQVISIQ